MKDNGIASNLVEALIYAAALDVYKRENNAACKGLPEILKTDKQSSAMLRVVDWKARPFFFAVNDSESADSFLDVG